MENKEIRRLNLRGVIDTYYKGVDRQFAIAINKKANEISRIFTENKNSKRNVSDFFAREVESLIDKPLGWMDAAHPELWGESKVDMVKSLATQIDSLTYKEKSELLKIIIDKLAGP